MPFQLTVEIVGIDPLRGSVTGGAKAHDFVGWLGFARLVGELAEGAERQPPILAEGAVQTSGADTLCTPDALNLSVGHHTNDIATQASISQI